MSVRPSPIFNVARVSGAPELPISPLAGEMSGRTEGGVKDRYVEGNALSSAATPLTIAARSVGLSLASNALSNAFASGTISR